MVYHKPFVCEQCGAWCKTIQGLRGHERFRHGVNASPARRYFVSDGQIVPTSEEGLTLSEAIEAARWEHLMQRLGRVEGMLGELLSRLRK